MLWKPYDYNETKHSKIVYAFCGLLYKHNPAASALIILQWHHNGRNGVSYHDQTKHQSSASLAFGRRIHRRPVIFPHKGPVTREMFPFDDVIMNTVPQCYVPFYFTACEWKLLIKNVVPRLTNLVLVFNSNIADMDFRDETATGYQHLSVVLTIAISNDC